MTVIMKKQDYDEKLVKMLSNDETYENLKRDPTAKTVEQVHLKAFR